jgi:hypothetical protein
MYLHWLGVSRPFHRLRYSPLRGIADGSQEFAANGICTTVTWPRCKYALAGKRDDGTRLVGQHADGTALSAGFPENAAMFALEFLNPAEVKRGDMYEAILPILWMMARASGDLELCRGSGKYHFPKGRLNFVGEPVDRGVLKVFGLNPHAWAPC